jgi:hypothetical protein
VRYRHDAGRPLDGSRVDRRHRSPLRASISPGAQVPRVTRRMQNMDGVSIFGRRVSD